MKFIGQSIISLCFFLIIFLITLLSLNYLFTTYHEVIHKNIFEDFGCKSKIVYGSWIRDSGKTIPQNCTANGQMALQHNFNDIVGYTFVPFLIGLSLGLTLLVFILVILVEINGKLGIMLDLGIEEAEK